MSINISEILSAPSVIRDYTVEPGFDHIDLRRTHYKVAHHEPFLLKIVKEEKKVFIAGETKVSLIMPCDRCLKDVTVTIPVRIDRFFQTDGVLDGEQDVDEINFMDGCMLDADRLVLDEILVALPTKILCKEDCKGLCPECGKDLNEGSCDCRRESLDPRMARILDVFRDS